MALMALASLVLVVVLGVPRIQALTLTQVGAGPLRELSSLPTAAGWSEPLRLTALTSNCVRPVLVVDRATGTLHLVWETEGLSVQYGYRDASGWRLDPLSGVGSRSWAGYSPAIALDSSGNPHVVYAMDPYLSAVLRGRGLAQLSAAKLLSQSQVFHRSPLRNWVPTNISNTSGSSQSPAISLVAPDGVPPSQGALSETEPGSAIHVAWAELLDGVQRIYHARSRDGGATWLEMDPIATGSAPTIAVAPRPEAGNQVWIAWQAVPPGSETKRMDIWTLYGDASGWSLPHNVSNTPQGDSRAPRLARDAAGSLHLVWIEESADGSSSAVYYATTDPRFATTSTADQKWSLPAAVSSGEGYASGPSLAAQTDGVIHVAWDAGARLELRSRGRDGGWGAIEEIAPRGASYRGIKDVTIAARESGELYAVWSARMESGEWALFFSERGADPTVTPMPPPSPTPTVTNTPESQPTIPTVAPTMTMTATVATGTPSPSPVTPSATPTATATRKPNVVERWFVPNILGAVPMGPLGEHTQSGLPESASAAAAGGSPSASQPAPLASAGAMESRASAARAQTEGREVASQAVPVWAWSDVVNISAADEPSPSRDSRAVASAVAPDGTVYAVWTERWPSGHWILFYSIRSNDTWSPSAMAFVGEEPDLLIAPDGGVHLVFANEFGGKYDIYYSQWINGQWTLPQNVSETSGTSSQPAIAAKADGTLVVVWTDTTEGSNRLYYGWRAMGLWNTFAVPHSGGASAPDIAVGAKGRVWVAFQALPENSSRYEIYVLGGQAVGNDWMLYAMNISDSPSTDSVAPRLAGHPSHGTFAVWQESSGQRAEVHYSDNAALSDFWELAENLSQTTAYSERPVVAVHSGGQVDVAWDEGDHILLVRRLHPKSPWLPPSAIASGDVETGQVALAAGVGGRVHAFWVQREPTLSANRDVYHRLGSLMMPYRYPLPLTFAP